MNSVRQEGVNVIVKLREIEEASACGWIYWDSLVDGYILRPSAEQKGLGRCHL